MTSQRNTFKIVITNNNTFKCYIVSYLGTRKVSETLFKFHKNDDGEYIPSISFEENSFSICNNDKKSVNLIQELYENPKEFKQYEFQFQHEKYSVVFEVLFSLIIS